MCKIRETLAERQEQGRWTHEGSSRPVLPLFLWKPKSLLAPTQSGPAGAPLGRQRGPRGPTSARPQMSSQESEHQPPEKPTLRVQGHGLDPPDRLSLSNPQDLPRAHTPPRTTQNKVGESNSLEEWPRREANRRESAGAPARLEAQTQGESWLCLACCGCGPG